MDLDEEIIDEEDEAEEDLEVEIEEVEEDSIDSDLEKCLKFELMQILVTMDTNI